MFKFNTLAPALFIVTLLTVFALFTFMYIIDLVAGITVGLQFCFINMCFVAGSAVNLHVLAV